MARAGRSACCNAVCKQLRRPPMPGQGLVLRLCPRCFRRRRPGQHASLLLGIGEHARLLRFIEHPRERLAPQSAVILRIPAADVAMRAGKPQLDQVLAAHVCGEQVLTEEAAPLVDRDGVTDGRDARVRGRMHELHRIPDPADRRNRVPHADEVHAEAPMLHARVARERVAELGAQPPDLRVLVFYASRAAEQPHHVGQQVLVARPQQPEHVQQPGQARAVYAPRLKPQQGRPAASCASGTHKRADLPDQADAERESDQLRRGWQRAPAARARARCRRRGRSRRAAARRNAPAPAPGARRWCRGRRTDCWCRRSRR